MRSHYRIGKRRLPLVAGLGLIFAGALLFAGVDPVDTAAPIATPTPQASVATASPSAAASITIPAATRDPQTPIATGYRIQIFRLGIDLPIEEGDIARDIDQQKTPVNFAFHLPGSAVPGQGGNAYLYAHARTGMFLSLWKARLGDVVFISTPDLKLLTYVVVDVQPRVAFDDVSVVQPTAREQLTLQTSTGPNPTDPRFVVVAIPAP